MIINKGKKNNIIKGKILQIKQLRYMFVGMSLDIS